MSKLPGIIIIFLVASIGGYYLWQFGIYAASTFTSDNPSFQANLTNTLDLQAGIGKPTFTRATVATVTDFEGLIKNVKSGEARFEGARRVENLALQSEAFDNASWLKFNSTITENATVSPNGTVSADKVYEDNTTNYHRVERTSSIDLGRSYTLSVFAKMAERSYVILSAQTYAGASAWFNLSNGTVGTVSGDLSGKQATIQNIGNGWYRVSLTWTANITGAATIRASVSNADNVSNYLGDGTSGIYVWGAQLEDVTGQANQNPSEYVSTGVKTSTPYHGANVDGVKYFTTYNGNTVASNVVTEATGANIPDATLHGYVAEGARTNLVLQSESIYTTNWAKFNNSTAGLATTTAPSGANTAGLWSRTSTSASYIYQVISKPASALPYTLSLYVKSNTGRYAAITLQSVYPDYVRATFDLQTETISTPAIGGTFTTPSASITSVGNGWYRITLSAVSSTSIGITPYLSFNSNGVAVDGIDSSSTSSGYFWGIQVEQASFASSYIPTTTASVTRNADVLSYPTSGNFSDTTGSAYAEYGHYSWSNNSSHRIIGNTAAPGACLFAGSNSSFRSGVSDNTTALNGPGDTTLGIIKGASKWYGSSMKAFSDGLIGSEGNYDGSFNLTSLGIGIGTNPYYGTIRNVKIWKKALLDGQLTNMTSTNASVSQSAVKTTTVGADGSSFQADLKSTLDLQAGVGVPTFTRATIATVTDFEGLIKNVKSGEARFEGARRVENLLTYSEDFSNAIWLTAISGTGITATKTPNYGTAPDGTLTACRVVLDKGAGTTSSDIAQMIYNATPVPGLTGLASAWIKTTDGSSKVVSIQNATGLSVVTVTGTWRRMTPGSATANVFTIRLRGTYGTSDTADLQIWHPMFENMVGQSNQNPSEYVSTNVKTSAPYHGANVDGVKYFTTYNGNTVASNVVTEATGANIPDATLHGYVAEGARTNLLQQSETFDNAYWQTASNITVIADNIVAPSGATTAEKFTEVASTATHRVSANNNAGTTIVSGTTYTLSAYFKKGTRQYQLLDVTDSGGGQQVRQWFDLDNGILGTNTTIGTQIVRNNATITSVGGGWYRATLTVTPTGVASNLLFSFLNLASGDGTISYLGDITQYGYFWGAQLEAGSFTSSYIPTTTASVTRNADVLTYPSAGNVTVLSDFSLYGEAILPTVTSDSSQILIGSNVNYMMYYRVSNNLSAKMSFFSDSGSGVAKLVNPGANQMNKYSGRKTSTTVSIFANGIKGTDGTNGAMATEPTQIQIGAHNSSSQLYGAIRNVKIWKKALTDTELTNMTSTNAAVSQSAVKKTIINASQNTKLTSGLVGLWSFNGTDISGITVYDRSGNNNNGTTTGGVTKTIGKIGQGLLFDGTSGYVSIPNSNSIGITGDMSISAWVKVTDFVNYNGILGKTNNNQYANPYDFYLNQTTGLPKFYRGNGNSGVTNFSLGTNPPALNQWQFIAVTMSGTNVTHYLNGVANGTGTINTTTTNGSDYLYIGSRGDLVTKMKGTLDEVRIYNRALSAGEVTQLYNLGR
jgi:3-methyladenine DNA glycosylase Tag